MTNVRYLDDQNLVGKIKSLVAQERENIAAQIVLLKEIKRRKLAIDLGYASLIDFCEKE